MVFECKGCKRKFSRINGRTNHWNNAPNCQDIHTRGSLDDHASTLPIEDEERWVLWSEFLNILTRWLNPNGLLVNRSPSCSWELEHDNGDAVPHDDPLEDAQESPPMSENQPVQVDVDLHFWVMINKWKQRARWGDNELKELLEFLFVSGYDISSMWIKSFAKFRKYTRRKLNQCGDNVWVDAEFPSPVSEGIITFRHRDGVQALQQLYANEKNVDRDFEWKYARMPEDEQQPRIYSTPSTGEWWRLAEVSNPEH